MSGKGSENNNSFNEENIINDQIDLSSLLSILLDNINLLISTFLVGFFLAFIIYITSENIFSSKSLIEIQQDRICLVLIFPEWVTEIKFFQAEVAIIDQLTQSMMCQIS